MATTRTPSAKRKPSSAKSRSKSKQSSLLSRRKLSKLNVLVIIGILVVAALIIKIATHASGGNHPYSRVDCTNEKNMMGFKAQKNTGVPSYDTNGFQACIDQSTEAWVSKSFIAILGRTPESPVALKSWSDVFYSFRVNPPVEFIQQFLQTDEAKQKFTNKTTEQKVDLLYKNVTQRDADPAGKAYWVKRMNKDGVASATVAFLWTAEALGKAQARVNSSLSGLTSSYKPESSLCGAGLNREECADYVAKVAAAKAAQKARDNDYLQIVATHRNNVLGVVSITTPAPPPPSCPSDRDMAPFSAASCIAGLQQRLVPYGYSGSIDGVWGCGTEIAYERVYPGKMNCGANGGAGDSYVQVTTPAQAPPTVPQPTPPPSTGATWQDIINQAWASIARNIPSVVPHIDCNTLPSWARGTCR